MHEGASKHIPYTNDEGVATGRHEVSLYLLVDISLQLLA